MRHLKYLSLFLVCVSCTKKIDVKIPEFTPTLTIHSRSVVGETLTATIGSSKGITKYNYKDSLLVKNAQVIVYTNGIATDTMAYDDITEMYWSRTLVSLNNNYKIVAKLPSYPDAEASMDVPVFIKISNIARNKMIRFDKNHNPEDELVISFNDPGGSSDYYMLDLLQSYKIYHMAHGSQEIYFGGGCIRSADPSIETSISVDIDMGRGGEDHTCLPSSGLLIKDQLFNGTRKDLRIYVPSYDLEPYPDVQTGDTFYSMIRVSHISEAEYRYRRSRETYENVGDNPFAEPVNVYSNIKNGYGIFTLSSYDTLTLK
jgi:hypothetical protein